MAQREWAGEVQAPAHASPARVVELPPQRQDPIAAFVDVHMGRVRHCSPATLVSYRLDLRRLRLFLDAQGKSLLDATRADLTHFVAGLLADGKARNTIRRQIAVLRSFYGWAERTGLTPTNPAAVMDRPSEQRRLPRIPSEAKIADLLDGIEAPKGTAPPIRQGGRARKARQRFLDATALRDRAILELLYGSALRVSELTELDRDDLDLRKGTVLVMGKGSIERVVPMSEPAVDALRRWLGQGESAPRIGEERPLWPNARGKRMSPRDVRRVLERRAPGLRPHLLRHASATHFLEGGGQGYARFRSSWAIHRLSLPSGIPTSPAAASSPSTARRTRGHRTRSPSLGLSAAVRSGRRRSACPGCAPGSQDASSLARGHLAAQPFSGRDHRAGSQ